MNRLGISAFCLCLFIASVYIARQGHVFAQQDPSPTPGRAIYLVEPDKVLLKVGETIDVEVSLLTAEGCTFGSAHFVMEAVDENIESSDLLQRISDWDWPYRPLPNSPSTSTWEAKELGSVKLVAYSFGEGVCQPDPATPAPFFHASASGVSQEILIVDHIYESFLPVVHSAP